MIAPRRCRPIVLASSAALLACSRAPDARRTDSLGDVAVVAPPAYDSTAGCPPTGHWAVCTVMERFKRAAFDVGRDSAVAHEAGLAQSGMRLTLAGGAITVYLYADSLQRRRDEAHLDTTKFLSPDAESTPNGRTLVRSDNLLAIMEVRNGRNRERVADALLGGPPQPAKEPERGTRDAGRGNKSG